MPEEQAVKGRQRRTPAQLEQIVREFRDSGLNGQQFCRRQGLSASVLYRYLKRSRSGGKSGGDGLVAVEVASEKASWEGSRCGLTVVLGRGRGIAVGTGFDVATLRRLVQALETM